MSRIHSYLIVILIVLALTAGCSAFTLAGDSEYQKSGEAIYAPQPAINSLDYSNQDSVAEERSFDTETDSLVEDQKLIITSHLSLEVQDVTGALKSIGDITKEYNGYIASSRMSVSNDGTHTGSVTIRVPSGGHNVLLSSLHSLGTVRSEYSDSQDVTEEYVDLKARYDALSHQLDQYMRIMEKAENVEEILKVQVQIERVQVEIERISGKLRYMDNRIGYATITVSLEEPAAMGSSGGYNIIQTINTGIEAALEVLDAIIITIFALLPVLIIGGGTYGLMRLRTRIKAKKTVEDKEKEE